MISETASVNQALLGGLFTYGLTALGASLVFIFKNVKRRSLDVMIGFGAGVMIAASFWSLLDPAIKLSKDLGYTEWLYPAMGFSLGGLFIVFSSFLLDKYYLQESRSIKLKSKFKRSVLLISSMTLHNIPEGLAVGVAFGSVSSGIEGADMVGAILLAIGIGLQNFPEGASVSLPLRRDGMSTRKAFFYGQLSGVVEPIAAVIGALAAISMRFLLPFLLSFAAGAMIAVVSSELIPEAAKKSKNIATIGVIMGFMVMMIMDVALG